MALSLSRSGGGGPAAPRVVFITSSGSLLGIVYEKANHSGDFCEEKGKAHNPPKKETEPGQTPGKWRTGLCGVLRLY